MAIAASATLQFPFVSMVLTGPHVGGSVGMKFFSPASYIIERMPPPLDLRFSDPQDSELAVLAEMFAIQSALLSTIAFPAVLVMDSLAVRLSDRARSHLLKALISVGIALVEFPFAIIITYVMGSDAGDTLAVLFFKPAFFLADHLPTALNFAPGGPHSSDFGRFIEFMIFHVFLSALVIFVLLVILGRLPRETHARPSAADLGRRDTPA